MKKRAILLLLVIAMIVPMVLSGCSSNHRGGQLIIGNTTELSGDWGDAQWTNNAADKDIRDFIGGYSPVALTRNAEYVYDENVAKVTTTPNADGTKTFTFDLAQDLKWNDGTAITAKDYVAEILLFSSPMIVELGATGGYGLQIVGYSEFNKARERDEAGKIIGAEEPTRPFSGVRLLGDYQFSITISADYLPYFFEMIYASVAPLARAMWLPANVDLSDEGEGAHFNENFTLANCQDTIKAARYKSDNRLSCGPYTLQSYDKTANEAILVINDNYKGDYQGQKPNIEKIVYKKVVTETMLDALKTGEVDLLTALAEGDEIKTALALVDNGGFNFTKYERNGYGKIMFQCDFGPTQFVNVRKAIAHLFDRNAFADTFCGGFGSVVHGPYGFAMWMYKEKEDELNKTLDTYEYDATSAIKLLEEDGWTLNEKGEAYTSGIRYKKVTAEEAGDYKHNVTLSDGTILMPLIIEWASTEKNSVSDLLSVRLANSDDTKKAGMQINQTVMTFSELLNWMYRDDSEGAQYGVKTYGMYNLASGFEPAYDQSYSYSLDPAFVAQGYNTNYIFDEQLDKLSMDMVYGVDPSDKEGYCQKWFDFIVRWNQLLPEIPLYSNIYHDVYNEKLKNWDVDNFWDLTYGILYAWVEE